MSNSEINPIISATALGGAMTINLLVLTSDTIVAFARESNFRAFIFSFISSAEVFFTCMNHVWFARASNLSTSASMRCKLTKVSVTQNALLFGNVSKTPTLF